MQWENILALWGYAHGVDQGERYVTGPRVWTLRRVSTRRAYFGERVAVKSMWATQLGR